MVYFAGKTSFSINMNKIGFGNTVNAFWINPEIGNSIEAGSFPNTGEKSFSTPDEPEDAILILEASDN